MTELIATVTVLAIITTVSVMAVGNTRTAVRSAKLKSDVESLNSVVGVYLASGGSLSGITDPQEVLNRLKTVISQSEKTRNVGIMSGRGIDARLSVRMQSSAEAGSSEARALWDSTKQKFVIETASGTQGIASFSMDNNLAGEVSPTETRDRSSVLYNGSTGWVWESGAADSLPLLAPADPSLGDQENKYNPVAGGPGGTPPPTSPPGGTTPPGGTSPEPTTGGVTDPTIPPGSTPPETTPTTTAEASILPRPIISPPGGMFAESIFPSRIYINPNGAPSASSYLKYRQDDGPWTIYTGPFSVKSGTKVTAQNFSSKPYQYIDSPADTQSYFQLISGLAGTSATRWGLLNTNTGVINMKNGDSTNATKTENGTNSLSFEGVPSFAGELPNTPFKLGEITYHAGAIRSNHASPTVILHVDLGLTHPVAISSGIDLELLVNVPDDPKSTAPDTLTLPSPVTGFSITIDKVTYTLQIGFGSIDPNEGTVFGTTACILRDATGHVSLMAVLVSRTDS